MTMPKRNPAAALIVLATSGLLAACGSDGDSTSEPFAAPSSFTLSLPETAVNTADAPTVAQAGALIDELVDEIEGQVDDIDELLRVTTASCRDGGSVAVSVADGSTGTATYTLDYDQCHDDDDLIDGRLQLVCTGSCTSDGTLVFGDGSVGYSEQSLDSDDRQAVLILGSVVYSSYNEAADTGSLVIDAGFEYSDPDGAVGAAQLDDFHYTATAGSSGHKSLSYDGDFASTAFALPASACNVAGAGSWSTVLALDDNDSADRIDSGQLQLGSDDGSATLSWASGTATASASGGTVSYGTREFDALCDL